MERVSARRFDVDSSEVRSTHVSTLLFDGDVVHKRKRAVRYPFVDMSTPERRAALCRREVDLNRRFAPDVYLGVEEVVDDDGVVVDHAVRMRRLPDDRRLSDAIGRLGDVDSCLRAVAKLMAVQHAGSRRSAQIAAVATTGAVAGLWSANLDEIAAFDPPLAPNGVLDQIEALALRYIRGREGLFAQRIAAGLIVDGHGDLLSEDIFCLPDGPRVLDCLEFDDRLRWGDVLYDVGFLAMDLEHHGHPDLARSFLRLYQEFSAETHPPSLADHYVAYRALVRAKVRHLRSDAVNARAHLEQCRRHLLAARTRLVAIGGLPGTGKSTLAAAIGRRLGWPVLRTDETRTEMVDAGAPHEPAAYGAGRYTAASTTRTYHEVMRRADALLANGTSVLLDGSFSTADHRRAAARVASGALADLVELRCVLPADVAAERIAHRQRAGLDPSDADADVAAEMARSFEPWPSAVSIDMAPPLDAVVPAALMPIGAAEHDRW